MKKKLLKRKLFKKLTKWINRKEILAIKGPRQAGKTTLLKMLIKWLKNEKKVNQNKIIFITLEDREVLKKIEQNALEFVKSFIGKNKKDTFYFLIDEFHYLENGGQILKLLYDNFDNVKFIITGSSSLELTNKTAKFLVGRVFFLNLWPFDFEEALQLESKQLNNIYQKRSKQVKEFIETSKKFSSPKKDIFIKDFKKVFEKYSIWGGYPEVLKTEDEETKKTILKNIYNTYIKKDIIEILKTTDHSTLEDLISLLAIQTGNLIKYNSLTNTIDSYFKEVKQYLSILEETFILNRINPYHKNKTKEIKKTPKIYFVDNGLRNYIINNFNPPSLRTDKGSLIENTVFSQFKKNNDKIKIKYWRTKSEAEVDFILEKQQKLIPVEVKYSNFKAPNIPPSFKRFIEKYNPNKGIILTKGFWGKTNFKSTLVRFIPVWYI